MDEFHDARCEAVYRAIVAFSKYHRGRFPTWRHIIDRTDITSTSVVSAHINHLLKSGHLYYEKGIGHVVTGAEWKVTP